ncbi:MAG: DDE-type integrase/transposase/recombinase [Betaproteobacteria bacterium]|nr:DDE-type integrase/transposase/recombinase [Betaproteobacteria bacterium]
MSFNLNLTNPVVGQQVQLHAQQYSIGLPLPDGRFSLTNVKNGTTLLMARQELAQKYLDGFAEHVADPVAATFLTQRKLNLLDLTIASEEDKKTVRRKQAYVDALDNLGVKTYQPSRFTQVIEAVAAEIGDVRKPTHWTLQRWRRDWERSQGDPRVFLPQRARRGNRQLRWPQELVQLAGQVAKEGLLTKQKHTVTKFCRDLETAIADANKFREPAHHIKMPSEGSVRRYCLRIDPFKFLSSRSTWRAADRTQKQYGRGVKTSRILERVEIDHTLLDLFVVDSRSGIILGRPWLTIVIDAHSRAILSFYLSFGPPSWVAVMEAMKRAILPKGDLRKVYPEIQHTWDCHGLMELAISDNGKEFVSANLDDGADALRIRIQLCPT